MVLLLLSMAVCGFADFDSEGFIVLKNSNTYLVNTEEFPEYDFYAFSQHYNFYNRGYKITSQAPLVAGSYEQTIRIVAVRKDTPEHEKKLLQNNQNPLFFDFCNITPLNCKIISPYTNKFEDDIVNANVFYKIAKIENKIVHLYLAKTETINLDRVHKTIHYKQPEILSYPNSFEKNVQQYQSVITSYFKEYNFSDTNRRGYAEYRLYLNPDKTVSLKFISSSADWDPFERLNARIFNLADRLLLEKRSSSSHYINFCLGVDSGKLYFEKSYNPYIESLHNPEILKTVLDTLVRVPVRKEFKLSAYLTKDFYLKLLSTVVLESFLLLLLSFFMTSIKNMKIIRLVGVGALASVITLPLLWFIWPHFTTNWLLYLWTGEIMVAAIEAVIYKKLLKINWRDAVIISVACNTFSCTIGLYANVWW